MRRGQRCPHSVLDGETCSLCSRSGYSRTLHSRVCPGRHFADQNVWAAIATILATVHVAKACDEFGNEIDVKIEFTGGLSS